MKNNILLKLKIFINNILLKIFRSTLFPYVFQIIGLLIYLALIYFSLGVVVPSDEGSKYFAQNHIVTIIVWGIWLPSLIIGTIFLGRLWCTICPLELVNKIGTKIGNRFRIKKFTLPKVLQSGIISVILYIALLFMVISTRFPRVPGNVAILLTILLITALLTGLIFRDRTFCKTICPAAMLLRVYHRRGIFRIGRESSKICAECNNNSCVNSCPNDLDPRFIKDSSNCTLCGECVKSCLNNNIVPFIRKMPAVPTGKANDFGWPVFIFAFFLSGFVIEEMFHEWHWGEHYYSFIPSILKQGIETDIIKGLINGIWSMIIVPSILWLLIGIIGKIFRLGSSILDIWKKISLPVITVIIIAQIIRAFTKFSHWITHFPTAVNNWIQKLITDPWPNLSFEFIFPERSEGMSPIHLFSNMTILMATIIIVLLFTYFAYKESKNIKSKNNGFIYITMLLAILFSSALIIPRLIK